MDTEWTKSPKELRVVDRVQFGILSPEFLVSLSLRR